MSTPNPPSVDAPSRTSAAGFVKDAEGRTVWRPGYVRLDESTVWPDPVDASEVAWLLRYGTPSAEVLGAAASAAAAYRELVWMPERRRRQVIKALREAAHEAAA